MSTDRRLAEHTVSLGDVRMPLLGLGTWQARGRAAIEAIRTALDVGYRHLDTATMYGNEREIGEALAESGVPREDVFLTTTASGRSTSWWRRPAGRRRSTRSSGALRCSTLTSSTAIAVAVYSSRATAR